jgi:NDP-sugar pyrophosphorylase family protein
MIQKPRTTFKDSSARALLFVAAVLSVFIFGLAHTKSSTMVFASEQGKVEAHRHVNPDGSVGGWVAKTATVSPTATIAFDAAVYGTAVVSGSARVLDKATVSGSAVVTDALIAGDATVEGNARIHGKVELSGRTVIDGHAKLFAGVSMYDPLLVLDSHIGGHAEVIGAKMIAKSTIVGNAFIGPDIDSIVNETIEGSTD